MQDTPCPASPASEALSSPNNNMRSPEAAARRSSTEEADDVIPIEDLVPIPLEPQGGFMHEPAEPEFREFPPFQLQKRDGLLDLRIVGYNPPSSKEVVPSGKVELIVGTTVTPVLQLPLEDTADLGSKCFNMPITTIPVPEALALRLPLEEHEANAEFVWMPENPVILVNMWVSAAVQALDDEPRLIGQGRIGIEDLVKGVPQVVNVNLMHLGTMTVRCTAMDFGLPRPIFQAPEVAEVETEGGCSPTTTDPPSAHGHSPTTTTQPASFASLSTRLDSDLGGNTSPSSRVSSEQSASGLNMAKSREQHLASGKGGGSVGRGTYAQALYAMEEAREVRMEARQGHTTRKAPSNPPTPPPSEAKRSKETRATPSAERHRKKDRSKRWSSDTEEWEYWAAKCTQKIEKYKQKIGKYEALRQQYRTRLGKREVQEKSDRESVHSSVVGREETPLKEVQQQVPERRFSQRSEGAGAAGGTQQYLGEQEVRNRVGSQRTPQETSIVRKVVAESGDHRIYRHQTPSSSAPSSAAPSVQSHLHGSVASTPLSVSQNSSYSHFTPPPTHHHTPTPTPQPIQNGVSRRSIPEGTTSVIHPANGSTNRANSASPVCREVLGPNGGGSVISRQGSSGFTYRYEQSRSPSLKTSASSPERMVIRRENGQFSQSQRMSHSPVSEALLSTMPRQNTSHYNSHTSSRLSGEPIYLSR